MMDYLLTGTHIFDIFHSYEATEIHWFGVSHLFKISRDILPSDEKDNSKSLI